MYRPIPTIVSVIALSAIAFAAPASSQGQSQQPRPDAAGTGSAPEKGSAPTTSPSTGKGRASDKKGSETGSAGSGSARPDAAGGGAPEKGSAPTTTPSTAKSGAVDSKNTERSQDKDGGQRRRAGDDADQQPKAAGSGAAEDGTRKGRQGDSGPKSSDDARQSKDGKSGQTRASDTDKSGQKGSAAGQPRTGAGEKSNDPGTAGNTRTQGQTGPSQRDATDTANDPQKGGASAGTQSQSRAATTGPRLSDEQRTSIQQAIVRAQPQRVRINIDVRVGAQIPRNIELLTLPVALISIVPAYRDYGYLVIQDRIAIVDPASYSVVEVIEYRERSAGAPGGQPNPPLVLSGDDRQFIYRTVKRDYDGRKYEIRAALGTEVPSGIELRRFPEQVTDRLPELGDYRYVVTGEHVLVVEPGDNEVVVVISD